MDKSGSGVLPGLPVIGTHAEQDDLQDRVSLLQQAAGFGFIYKPRLKRERLGEGGTQAFATIYYLTS